MTTESNVPGNAPNRKPNSNLEPPVSSDISPALPVASKLPRRVSSAVLLQGDREIQIVHGDEVYRLSLTRQGKLILHK